MNDWFERAFETPESFRDPASVAALLAAALDATAHTDERDAAAGALCWVVKALESDPVEASARLIVERLPDLAGGLLDPDPYYQGQMISILRRFCPDARTAAHIIALLAEAHAPERELLVVALGLVDPGEWSEDVEATLACALADPVCAAAAARALYNHATRISRSETVGALAAAVPELSTPLDRPPALNALALIVRGPLAVSAEAALRELAEAQPDLRPEIAAARELFRPR